MAPAAAPAVAAEGWMMKKKKSLLSVLSTRYFVLTTDGTLDYYKDKPGTPGAGKPDTLSDNVAQCSIGPAKESDMVKGHEKAVHYSFVITGPGKKGKGHHSTLLVTSSPSDFRKWISVCRGMGTTMLEGVDAGVKDVQPRAQETKPSAQDVPAPAPAPAPSPAADVSSKKEPEESTKEEAPPSPPAVDTSNEEDPAFEEFQNLLSGDVPPPSSIKKPDDSVDTSESLHVSFKPGESEEIVAKVGAPQDRKLEVSKSVSFSEGEDVVIDDDEMGSEEAEAEDAAGEDGVEDADIGDAEAEEEDSAAEGDNVAAKKAAEEEALAKKKAEEEEEAKRLKKEAARKRMMEAKARSEARRVAKEEGTPKEEEPVEAVEDPAAEEKEETPEEEEPAQPDAEPSEEEAIPAVAPTEPGNDSDEKLKVFAYGDTYDELTKALDSKKVLFGVLTTSIEDMGDDDAYLNSQVEDSEKLVAISIEYEGGDAHYNDVKAFKNHLHEIGPLCRAHFKDEVLVPIVYEHEEKAKEQILTILGAGEKEKEEEDNDEYPGQSGKTGGDWVKAMGITYENVGVTSYKHAINTRGVNTVPNGPDLLAIVRDKLGQPYNWVLFRASKKELIVEDAGSGGVMEMALVVNECYSDKVLFGLARLSFSGDFGLKTYLAGLEWKGPNCSGVKAMMAMRESLAPMKEMIGRRAFTISNDMLSDMTPGALVDCVKKSQNVGHMDASVSVTSMKNAHLEEQKAIEKYWKRQEEKEKAKKQYEKETKDAAENADRMASLKVRDERVAKSKVARAARREQWSKSTAPEILQSLGEESFSGWVLLEYAETNGVRE